MWKIPTDTAQTARSNGRTSLQEVTVDTPLDDVFKYWDEDGAVLIKGILTPWQVQQMNAELEPVLEKVQRGSVIPHEALQAFHGRKTRRAGDIVNNSAIFRDHVVENDFLHAICKRCYSEGGNAGDYWLSAATTLNAAGPQASQQLHRDLGSYPPYALLGPEGTKSQINFLIATTEFRDDNGATRVIPGSHKWSFDQRGKAEQTIPAAMKAGDCLLISDKVVHGMGENKTNEERGCTQMSVCASYLTPAEAHPFVVKLDVAKKLSRRAQRFLGFRSQYPRGSPGLWTKDYMEVALHLGLDDFGGVMQDLQEISQERSEHSGNESTN